MPKQRIDPAIARTHELMDWLATFELPTRASNALRRDLEVTLGIRAGKAGSGILATMDKAQFVEELYRANGGQIRNIPGVADTAISALRAAIPPPAGAPDPTADDFTLPLLDDEEPAVGADFILPPLDEQDQAQHAPDDDAALHPAVHFGDDPEEAALADDVAELAQLDADPTVSANPNRRVPRRRGRPRRTPTELVAPLASPVERVPPPLSTSHTASTNGAHADAVAIIAPEPISLAATQPLRTSDTVTITEEARLLQLWSALHPQGRRATLGFIATLVAEE